MKAILLNRILLILAFLGLFIAGTLAIEASTNSVVPCGPSSGCETVANHPASKIAGIPVAFFGLVGYLLLTALAARRMFTPVRQMRPLVHAGYLVAALGTIVSLYLQYVSFFVIRATCIWCLSSALLMIVTLVGHALLSQQLDPEAEPERKGPGIDVPLLFGLPLIVGIGLAVMSTQMKPKAMAAPNLAQTKNVELVPEGAHIYGQKDAPLTVVEFADILCPACQRTSPAVKDYVAANSGRVRLVFRHYPIPQLHPQANVAAAIAEVASEDGKFWDFTLAVMGREMKPEAADELFEVAKSVGVDTAKARERLGDENDAVYDRVARDLKAVKDLGVTSTPTFFVVHKGKIIDTLGPGQILERLNSPDLQKLMSEAPGGVAAP